MDLCILFSAVHPEILLSKILKIDTISGQKKKQMPIPTRVKQRRRAVRKILCNIILYIICIPTYKVVIDGDCVT